MSEVVVRRAAREGHRRADMPVIGALAAVAGLIFLASLLVGPTGVGLPQGGEAARMILMEIRLPRAILGALIGGALGLSGAVLQGYLRNPLAEPGLLGISGGAALGAVTAIHTGAAGAFALALPLGGLVRRRYRRVGRDAARGRAQRAADADPRRCRDLEPRRRADDARAQPVAQSVRLRRDAVLAPGLAHRPQPRARVACSTADPCWAARCC